MQLHSFVYFESTAESDAIQQDLPDLTAETRKSQQESCRRMLKTSHKDRILNAVVCFSLNTLVDDIY